MTPSLRAIERCFQGVIPSYVATADAAGLPNVTALSIVHLLGPTRVGLSCQFMNKTLKNLEATRRAQVFVMDPETLVEYQLDLTYLGALTQGEVFERMDAQVTGMASQTGAAEHFNLVGVLECEVDAWRAMGESQLDLGSRKAPDALELLDRVAVAIQSATDLDALLDGTFSALDEHLGFNHGFFLMMDESSKSLYNVASHGFDSPRFGAEIALGEGIYGTSALRRSPARSGSMTRARILSQAVARATASEQTRELPLPGLADAESSLAVPVESEGRCLGVLCFQSPEPAAFSDEHERMLCIVARHLAAMIRLLRVAENREVQVSGRRGPIGSRALATRIKFYESDGSVFVGDEYLIKGVAGRILWRVVSTYVEEQREEFSNKEIRLDQNIGLPAIKDNLEARLIALRKRLGERNTGLSLEKTGRGRFRLQVERELILQHMD
jgi:hypothetical protein